MRIAVLGAGSWGIAIAELLHRNGHAVSMWEFDPAEAELLLEHRTHPEKLPQVQLDKAVIITDDLERAVRGAELICFVVPSHTVRKVAGALRPILRSGATPLVVNLAKGIENETLLRMSQVIREEFEDRDDLRVVTLSGPSHAEEVAMRVPTTVAAASADIKAAVFAQGAFMNDRFRVYTNPDIVGVELAGSLKNVIAIASGMIDGLGLGDNTRGALLARGLAEMARLGVKMGSEYATFAGLAGVGDLVTTCVSRHSRNRYVGEQLGKGRSISDVLSGMVMVAEGVKTAKSARDLSLKFNVEMPITEQVYRIIYEGKSASQALLELMTREPKAEIWG